MQKIEELMREKAAALLQDGTADCVLAWRRGEFPYDHATAVFHTGEELEELTYDCFCPANLAKYLIQTSRAGQKAAVFLKPCDTYGVNQLLKDHRIRRDLVHAVGTPCGGMLDIRKIRAAGCRGIVAIEDRGGDVAVTCAGGPVTLPRAAVLLRKCLACKGNDYKIADEEIGAKQAVPQAPADRFAEVEAIEAMTPEGRFAFWQQELSRCRRLAGSPVPCHPRLPRGGPVHGLRRMRARVPRRDPPGSAERQIRQRHQHLFRAVPARGRRRNAGAAVHLPPRRSRPGHGGAE